MKVKTPAPTPEDPAIAAARVREQTRADAAFVSNTQGVLDEETRKRARRFGRRVSLAGANPASGGAAGGGSTGIPLLDAGGGAGSFGEGVGSFGSGFGGLSRGVSAA